MTGFVLAGIGHRTVEGQNFLIVKQGPIVTMLCNTCVYNICCYYLDTEIPTIEDAFRNYTSRNDVGIVLINQHVSNRTIHDVI